MNSSASIRQIHGAVVAGGRLMCLAVASLAVVSVTGCTADQEPKRSITGPQPFDASALTSALQRIVAWHQGNDTTTANALRPGLRDAELQQQLKKLPCQLPLELLVATGLLHHDEFPVLEFEGEYYVVRCGSGVSARSPVWHVHQNPERVANYDENEEIDRDRR